MTKITKMTITMTMIRLKQHAESGNKKYNKRQDRLAVLPFSIHKNYYRYLLARYSSFTFSQLMTLKKASR